MGPVERKGAPPRRRHGRRFAAWLVALLAAGPVQGQTLGTSFTYQGRLTDAGNPANGPYDLRFTLFDAASGGAQVGTTLTRDDVAVANGLFTVSLDFGSVFSGSKRWLEIGVRPGASTGAFSTLAGRQELTPGPNAVFSSNAPWAGLSGKPAGFADDTDNDALGGLSCANGQVAKWNGTAWACAADADSGGDITGVTAGTALTGGGTTGAVTLNVNLAGSGAASTVARSDHNHLNQNWSGTGNGLRVESTDAGGLIGATLATSTNPAGVMGTASATTGRGVWGQASATTGFAVGVFGESASSQGIGVFGTNSAIGGWGVEGYAAPTVGNGIGVVAVTNGNTGIALNATAQNITGANFGAIGTTFSTAGTGVWGNATAASGPAVGVLGRTASAAGFGGVFENTSGGPALRVGNGGIRFGDGTTQTTAATGGGGGDITAVLTPASSGLTGGASSGDVTLGVSSAAPGHPRRSHAPTTTTSGKPGADPFTSSVAFRIVNSGGGLGFTDGAWGQSDSAGQGRGVVGYATNGSGTNYGVWGQADSTAGVAVFGTAPAGSGPTTGVLGETSSPTGRGVYGHAANAAAASTYGVFGQSDAGGDGRGVGGSGVFGVYATGSRAGSYGTDTIPTFNGAGIWGQSVSTDNGAGVFGQALGTTGLNYAVYGQTLSTGGYAGFFVGRVNVTGTLSKGGGSFKIDHPLDPENKYLYHSFVESPDMMNIYNGNVTTDARGFATVELPEWFEALNRDFRYQLTVIDSGDDWVMAKIVREVEDNRFVLRTSVPGTKVSWQVTGIRHDAFAEKFRIPLEEDKTGVERGRLLYPEAYGRSRDESIDRLRQPTADRGSGDLRPPRSQAAGNQ